MPKPPGQAGPLGGARKPFEVGGFVGQKTATSMVFGFMSSRDEFQITQW